MNTNSQNSTTDNPRSFPIIDPDSTRLIMRLALDAAHSKKSFVARARAARSIFDKMLGETLKEAKAMAKRYHIKAQAQAALQAEEAAMTGNCGTTSTP